MKFRRRLELQSNLNLVPMVDVVFQLVLFFLVSTTFVLAPGIKLTLPASGTAESVVMEQMVVTVVSPSEVYMNKERFGSLPELEARIAAMPGGGEEAGRGGDHRGGPGHRLRPDGGDPRRAAEERLQERRAEDPRCRAVS